MWLVPIPSAAAVARSRGGQHVQRLARRAARILRRRGVSVRVAPVLALASGRPDTAELTAAERGLAAAGKFVTRPQRVRRFRSTRVVIVDDLVTTGNTVAAAAAALRVAGLPVAGAAAIAGTQRKIPWYTHSNSALRSVAVRSAYTGGSPGLRRSVTRRPGTSPVADQDISGVSAPHSARLPSRRTWVEEASRRHRLWFRWCAARGGPNSPRCGAARGGRPSPHWRSRGRYRQGPERGGARPLPAARHGEDRAGRAVRPPHNSCRCRALPRTQPAPVGILPTRRGDLRDPWTGGPRRSLRVRLLPRAGHRGGQAGQPNAARGGSAPRAPRQPHPHVGSGRDGWNRDERIGAGRHDGPAAGRPGTGGVRRPRRAREGALRRTDDDRPGPVRDGTGRTRLLSLLRCGLPDGRVSSTAARATTTASSGWSTEPVAFGRPAVSGLVPDRLVLAECPL